MPNIDLIPGFSIIDNAVNAIPMLGQLKFFDYVLTFFMYSIVGWCMETSYCSLAGGKFINRGFLTGPMCPIYGTGGLVFSLALSRFAHRWYVVLLLGVVLADIVEYLTSYIMEKLFHARWWDYTHEWLNINGRICLKHTFYWGIASLVYIYLFQYYYLSLYLQIPQKIRYIALAVIFCIFIVDLINAAKNAMDVKQFKAKLASFSGSVAELKNKLTGAKPAENENVSGLTKQLHELRTENTASKPGKYKNRMYKVYGNLRASSERTLNAAEELLAEIKKHFTDDSGEMY